MNRDITIVGAGWAGLAAAVELSSRGHKVTVYESARHAGGRARDLQHQGRNLDNGQHLMIGAYQQMLQLLHTVGIKEYEVLLRMPQQLTVLDYLQNRPVFKLKLPRLPAPWHLLAGIFKCPSLTGFEKIQTLLRFNALLKNDINQDISVDQWLATAKLPAHYVNYLLKPLCLAALTTHTSEASARAFQTILRQTFNGPASNTDLLIAKTSLGQLFPQAAVYYIQSCGGRVLLEQRVSDITSTGRHVDAIVVNNEHIKIEQLILATPAPVTHKLLESIAACGAIIEQLQQLEHEPVTTVYCQYPITTRLPQPVMGVVNARVEWLFDRRVCEQPGLIAAVISASGDHMNMDKTFLAETVAIELKRLFPDWPEPEDILVIREKRATIRCHSDVDLVRPGIQTPLDNLRLCGDYVYIEENNQAGLPSTLEGAVRSGVKCAQTLLKEST